MEATCRWVGVKINWLVISNYDRFLTWKLLWDNTLFCEFFSFCFVMKSPKIECILLLGGSYDPWPTKKCIIKKSRKGIFRINVSWSCKFQIVLKTTYPALQFEFFKKIAFSRLFWLTSWSFDDTFFGGTV